MEPKHHPLVIIATMTAASGLAQEHAAILGALSGPAGLSYQQTAVATALNPFTLRRYITVLRGKGFIAVHNPGKGKEKILTITGEGRAWVDRILHSAFPLP